MMRWIALALCVGCQTEEKPSKVEIVLAETLTSADPVPVTLRLFDEVGASSISRAKRDYELAPEGIATVTPQGMLACTKSGDANISVNVGGVAANAKVRCRLVDRISANVPDRIVINDGPIELTVTVTDASGAALTDVPVSLRTSNSRAVRVKGVQITPTAVGAVKLTAQAGTKSVELETRVVRRVDFEPVTIGDGKKISFSVDPGKYEVKAKLDSPKALSTEWVGAGSCNRTTKEAEHRSECTVQKKTTLIIDNPSYLNTGSTESTDGVSIYEIP